MSIVTKINVVLKRAILFTIASILTVTNFFPGEKAYAANCDQDFFAQNDILYYDGCAKSSCSPGSGISVALSGDDNEQKILNFFMRKGLNLAQASGFIGNMNEESQLRSNIIESRAGEPFPNLVDENYTPENGRGFGLVQWTFDARQKPLMEFMDELGVPYTDLGGQLEFVWKELNEEYLTSTLNPLRSVNNPIEAAVIIHDNYEVSAQSREAVVANRGGHAQEVYNKYKDADPLAGSEAGDEENNPTDERDRALSSNGCGGGVSGGGSLTELVLKYAHPEEAPNANNKKPMPDYATAVESAQKEGYYVGGINHPGIDCGGFVTLLIRNSNFDKGYNFGGKISNNAGNTTQQEAWAKENWEYLGSSTEIDPAELQPGDVAINPNHTFIYVGEIEGFNSKIAAASLDTFAPLAHASQSPTEPGYNWYRKK